jgi:hypothetical protein
MQKPLLFLTAIFTFAFFTLSNAQNNTESNCYLKWVKKFEERGSDDIADGTYDDVIITYRTGHGTGADCYNGKVEVAGGKIVKMWLKQDGGTYEPIEKKSKFPNTELKIVNGISTTLLTNEDILINVIFYKKLKAKKPGYQKAPEPGDD